MHAKETTFAALVQGEKQFQVPLYQRTYSWTEKELRPLWSDVLEQAQLLADGSTGATHFLGSVVLAPSPQTAASFTRWLVVDGQQRLTTLSLALMAVRDHVAAAEPMQRERLNDVYLINKYKNGDARLRLLPTQADRDTYAQHVHATHNGGGSDRIAAAYRFFRQELLKIADVGDPYDVALVEQAVTTRLTLVEISADKADNVHRIFESLNNTGLKLSQADLLRNYLFMRLPTRDENVYATHWLPLQQQLTNAQLEQLMWLQLVLDGDDQVRLQDIYAAQQARFDVIGTDEATVEAYVVELHRRAGHLVRILNPDQEQDARVRDHLHRLQDWQGTTTYPVLMALFDQHTTGELSDDDLVLALSYIESFLVRRTLCRIPTNNLVRIFQAVPAQLPARVPIVSGLHRVLSATKRFWPTDEDLREAIRTKPFYLQSRGIQRKIVLRRLEESLGHPEPVDFAKADLTIEHVLPQSPGEDWLALLAKGAADGESAEDVHSRLVHTLGNLTLTGQNAQLSNHPFQRKQDLLAGSHLAMNQRIAAAETWGAADILARADELAGRAVRLWPAPLPGVERVERGRDWDLLHQALAAMPDGTWTTYRDLATLIGSHAVPVGRHLADSVGLVNAHRALSAPGRISEGFRWSPGHDRGDVRTVLESEGVHFTEGGLAEPTQRLTTGDLATLIGLADYPDAPAVPPTVPVGGEARWNRFLAQLTEHNAPDEADAVRSLLDHWADLGGIREFGAGATVTSCFLTLERPGDKSIWPLAVYPTYGGSGYVEVVFQYLAVRAPFDDPALRSELRTRLNRLDGVDIPVGKLALRPSFPMAVLGDPDNLSRLRDTLSWFADIASGTDTAAG
ncbi:DUF262 domain-containing protein [Streptomyces sp. SID3343]|uniref:GmrSD restriction endonuclease domain-containing protein n=1 Tax=Streptomyces sp. SID3343 TaxID=2690260 RepID=UPI001370DC32|nr:DUF262 domain-containing protein [Streptomyces sp. SID3343]MYW05831.1 DUF262 domain-containing protein [Streptomyces sp. SID3343]